MKEKLIITFVIFFITNVNAAEMAAPFGFEWGMSKKKVEGKGVVFDKCETNLTLTICTTKKAIKSISFGERYSLIFDSRLGLQKVSLISKNVTGDITGSSGKKLYSKVKDSLTKKYGDSESYEYVGRKLYKEYDEFYQCLKYPGCGTWTAFWQPTEGGVVVAELKGLARGTGYLNLAYESKKWSNVIDARKAKENSSDDDAL